MRNKRVRICMITPFFFPGVGGTEIMVDGLANELVRRGHDVCVITPKYKDACKADSLKNYKVYRFPLLPVGLFTRFSSNPRFSSYHWLFKFLLLPLFILYYDLKEHFHLIHAHYITPSGTGGVVGKLLGIPLIVTTHGEVQVNRSINYGVMLSPITAAVMRLTLKFVDKLILVSDHMMPEALNAGASSEKIEVAYNFVDLNGIKSGCGSILKKYGLEKGAYVLYVGRLAPEKGLLSLLKNIKEIFKSKHDLKFAIAGYGIDECKLKSYVHAENLDNSVMFVGCVKEAQKWDLFANSLAVVMPSITEAFGLSAIEAMASGTTIIAMNKPPFCEYIENGVTGILVDNMKDFPREITNLMRNPEKKRLIDKNAKKFVETNFSLENICSKYEEIYKEVLGTA